LQAEPLQVQPVELLVLQASPVSMQAVLGWLVPLALLVHWLELLELEWEPAGQGQPLSPRSAS
jgi:hypothetical protein